MSEQPQSSGLIERILSRNETADSQGACASIDQLPPHDTQAEAGALACVLLNPDHLDKLEWRDFYDERHKVIFDAIKTLDFRGFTIDIISLCQFVKDSNLLTRAGGFAYVQALPDQTPSEANFSSWLETLKDRAERRRMLAEAGELARAACDTSKPVDVPGGLLPDAISWQELLQPVSYDGNLLGNRFLERGCGLLLFGPAGCGKSVAGLQGCVEWSAGLDGFHLKPSHALRIVIIQTEDSLDDTRESLAGILASTRITAEHRQLIAENLVILPPIPGGSPDSLTACMERAAERYRPDMLSVNPLLAFCPGDPARELGGILYNAIDPVIKRYGIGFLGVHHTPKTNNRDTSDYGTHDYQYLAAGDARVANWPRAMISIEEVKYPVYRFRISKRGHRAEWTCDGEPTTERYFRHHPKPEVRWVDSLPDEVSEAKRVEDYRRILTILPAPEEPGISRERMHERAKTGLSGLGKNKADEWLKLAIEDGLAETIEGKSATNRTVSLFRQKMEAAA